ncbi:uncharacterized protein BJ171DRAFT_505813 [Polychytrium aggregatum]|uniref:uncharacterized protein n=1 Tax=Polychytrium aggregatum TaxID=110093 RepID=UPI0022FE40F6|nr:uncharacterized protein BJ171DRAFT_505813 [Polychytrium aggregatum]KAI9204426.1 hypothetical protein BJ171DRAFT_505813 [Polychytrium aggregatum]
MCVDHPAVSIERRARRIDQAVLMGKITAAEYAVGGRNIGSDTNEIVGGLLPGCLSGLSSCRRCCTRPPQSGRCEAIHRKTRVCPFHRIDAASTSIHVTATTPATCASRRFCRRQDSCRWILAFISSTLALMTWSLALDSDAAAPVLFDAVVCTIPPS